MMTIGSDEPREEDEEACRIWNRRVLAEGSDWIDGWINLDKTRRIHTIGWQFVSSPYYQENIHEKRKEKDANIEKHTLIIIY